MALLLNAPKSAKRASTPVKASKSPPRDLHPSSPFLTRYAPAKEGLKALRTLWSNLARLYIPAHALNNSHIKTIGAKELAIFVVPKG